MKRIIFILLMSLFEFCAVYSQSAIQQAADRAFAAGKYSDAIQLYEMAASTIASNESEREKMYDAANKCRKIVSLHKQADNLFKEKKYLETKKVYQALLSINQSDIRAQERVAFCSSQINNESLRRVREAEHNAKRDPNYQNAISSGDVELFKDFVADYPKDEVTPMFKLYITIKTKDDYCPKISEIPLYKQLGDIFLEVKNVDLAREMYDLGASVCDLESMTKKALTYKDSDLKKAAPLLVIAAAGKYQPAIDL